MGTEVVDTSVQGQEVIEAIKAGIDAKVASEIVGWGEFKVMGKEAFSLRIRGSSGSVHLFLVNNSEENGSIEGPGIRVQLPRYTHFNLRIDRSFLSATKGDDVLWIENAGSNPLKVPKIGISKSGTVFTWWV